MANDCKRKGLSWAAPFRGIACAKVRGRHATGYFVYRAESTEIVGQDLGATHRHRTWISIFLAAGWWWLLDERGRRLTWKCSCLSVCQSGTEEAREDSNESSVGHRSGWIDGLTALNDTVTRECTESRSRRWGKWRAKRDVAWGRGQKTTAPNARRGEPEHSANQDRECRHLHKLCVCSCCLQVAEKGTWSGIYSSPTCPVFMCVIPDILSAWSKRRLNSTGSGKSFAQIHCGWLVNSKRPKFRRRAKTCNGRRLLFKLKVVDIFKEWPVW